jgi:hypothetical protein
MEVLYGVFLLFSSVRTFISDQLEGMLGSNAVERGFEPQSGQTKDYKIGICCFSTKHAALKSKSRD